ncbi:Wzz/FepE/Etk N-terminal domain-containing protein [Haloglycomyces albus]|uniref:Wzz/FepE/Etk N-terminal domain-containing protein n=1 Tax=Haloglycomyces albus TaxID=526067 RepID=UPI00046D2C7D|nr:Wzz/FepE/Etk N-terminal domain-containing protein [Haloglycomyces albus]
MSNTSTGALNDYATMLRRSRWLMITMILSSIALGVAFTAWQDDVYESRTSVLVQPVGTERDVAQARTNGQINLDTEAQLVRSTEIAASAAEKLGESNQTKLRDAVDVTVPPNTAVLEIRFQASEAEAAQQGAIAYSEAYLEHRHDQAVTNLAQDREANTERKDGLVEELDILRDRLANTDPEGSAYTQIQGDMERLNNRVAELENENAELKAAEESLSPGRTINSASLPTQPVSPNALLNVGAAAAVGLIFALLIAYLRHQGARRVLYPSDVTQRCGVDVIGAVPNSVRFRSREVFGAYSPGGRLFSQMRNVVVSQLGERRKIIVTVGVSPGPAASIVVANLGSAMARSGDRTVVIAGNPTSTVGLSELSETNPIPGLSDIWSGRVSVKDACFVAPRRPGLQVIGSGAAARATGPTSEATTDTFQELAEGGNIVVVDAPPLSCSADAQMFASHADGVVLAVQTGRDSVKATMESIEAIEKVGTRIIGVVLLPSDLGPMMEAPAPGRAQSENEGEAADNMPADNSPTDALDVVEKEGGEEQPSDDGSPQRKEPAGQS